MNYVYILQHNKKNEIYIGKTKNLKQRILEHNKNKQTSTVRKNGRWKIVYVEIYKSKLDADKRELRLKDHGRAKQELLKRLSNSLNDRNQSGAGHS
jgi:putative endonuclease